MKKQVVLLSCLTFVLVFLAPFPGDAGFPLIPLLDYDDIQLPGLITTAYHPASLPVSSTELSSPSETASFPSQTAMGIFIGGSAAEEKYIGSSIASDRSDRQLFNDPALQYSSLGDLGTSELLQNGSTLAMNCREPFDPVRFTQNHQTYSPRILPSVGWNPGTGEHSKKPAVMNHYDMPGPEIHNFPGLPALTLSSSAFGGPSSIMLVQPSDLQSSPDCKPHESNMNGPGDSLRQRP